MSSIDLDRSTLSDVVAALAGGGVSSRELLEAQLDRIDIFNPSVNAVVAFDIDRARGDALAADNRRAAGEAVGPLEGVSLTIKDTYETAGCVTTAGSPNLADHVPEADADVVQGLRQAGGVIYGKTNVPLFAGDHQTYNDVYGLTRNAWDPDRTAGGSSGGSAVSVSCGFSTGEFGSDIGGSIRLPAHFNGIFGLKPSLGVVSYRGHVPSPPGSLAPSDLTVGGPLGRSADDLSLLLDASLSVGAMQGVPGASLPTAKPIDLKATRVGVWSDDPISPVDAATRAAIESFAASLSGLGVEIEPDARPSQSSADLHDIYSRLLFPVTAAGLPSHVRQQLVDASAGAPRALDAGDPSTFEMRNMRDSVSSHRSWLAADERRHQAIASWQTLFESIDVMVMPVCQTQAFPHNFDARYADRVTLVDDVERGYHELLFWAGLATMPLLPSVVVPLGPINGLPMGVQLVGPRWSDRSLLALAKVISESLELQFVPPTLVTG